MIQVQNIHLGDIQKDSTCKTIKNLAYPSYIASTIAIEKASCISNQENYVAELQNALSIIVCFKQMEQDTQKIYEKTITKNDINQINTGTRRNLGENANAGRLNRTEFCGWPKGRQAYPGSGAIWKQHPYRSALD